MIGRAAIVRDFMAREFGFEPAELVGSSQKRAVAHARQGAMWMVRRVYPDLSYPMIGRIFGDRDHSTVMHGVRQVEDRMKRDSEFAERMNQTAQAIRKLGFTLSASDLAELEQRWARMVQAAGQKRKQFSAKCVAEVEQRMQVPQQSCKPRNRMDPDDHDAFRRREASVALGAAVQRALAERAAIDGAAADGVGPQ